MTHEFGHLLGMGHSRHNAAVMAPFYKGYEKNFHLDVDDVQGIQTMYGKQCLSSGHTCSSNVIIYSVCIRGLRVIYI